MQRMQKKVCLAKVLLCVSVFFWIFLNTNALQVLRKNKKQRETDLNEDQVREIVVYGCTSLWGFENWKNSFTSDVTFPTFFKTEIFELLSQKMKKIL